METRRTTREGASHPVQSVKRIEQSRNISQRLMNILVMTLSLVILAEQSTARRRLPSLATTTQRPSPITLRSRHSHSRTPANPVNDLRICLLKPSRSRSYHFSPSPSASPEAMNGMAESVVSASRPEQIAGRKRREAPADEASERDERQRIPVQTPPSCPRFKRRNMGVQATVCLCNLQDHAVLNDSKVRISSAWRGPRVAPQRTSSRSKGGFKNGKLSKQTEDVATGRVNGNGNSSQEGHQELSIPRRAVLSSLQPKSAVKAL